MDFERTQLAHNTRCLFPSDFLLPHFLSCQRVLRWPRALGEVVKGSRVSNAFI